MDRRSWPWKKKSTDKTISDNAVVVEAATESSNASASAEETYKKPSYIQISVEKYAHLTGLEDHVKSYEEQVHKQDIQIVKLNEKLSAAQEEIVTKEGLVKQHAKVAEEAISGWEKAETQASTLKIQLEAITLEKLTAEDRAAHLDSALKECRRQIRNLKEAHEQELHDAIFSKTKQFEKLKLELESKIANLDQELLRSEADNTALARSLQERSDMLIKISEQKSQAEVEIEYLKGNNESCEREISSLKYELHIAAKQLEIRTEEKNMSVRSADVSSKQHMEAAKKISKLEAECQRLRSLVRKKLPGPAALAQMKIEVESLGRDYGDNRRRSLERASSPHSPFPDFQLEEMQKLQNDNEILTERLLTMEDDTQMLKEALAKRNIELQDCRDLCASIANKLRSLEAKTQTDSKSMPLLANARSLTSMSEDGNEYAPSSTESWSTGLNSDLSQIKQGKFETANNLDLMDDFLEMEKLACSSNKSNGLPGDPDSSMETATARKHDLQNDTYPRENNTSSQVTDADQLPLMKLQSRIPMLFEYISKESDGVKILEDMMSILNGAHDSIHHQPCYELKKIHCSDASCDRQIFPEDAGMTTVKEISSSQDSEWVSANMQSISKEIAEAIYQIHDFVESLGKGAEAVQDLSHSHNSDDFVEQVKEFLVKFSRALNEKISLVDFVADLSHILQRANEFRFSFLGKKQDDAETNGSDCIDKVALPGHKFFIEDTMGDTFSNGCSDSVSNPEVPSITDPVPGVELKCTSCICLMKDFENVKIAKENLEAELLRCSKDLENRQSELSVTGGKLSELKSQLDLALKSNGLAETQLKCMVESYRSLERRAEELETEIDLLHEKAKKLDDELQEEKTKHQNALDRCDHLQEQLQRNISNSESAMPDADHKTNQEKELAAAAEKLAECQETIFLLGRQLKSFRPQPEPVINPQQDVRQRVSSSGRVESNITFDNMLDLDRGRMEAAPSSGIVYNALYVPSDSEANSYLRSPINIKHQKHKSDHSLPPAYAAQTPGKHSRGISRFFSTKGKF